MHTKFGHNNKFVKQSKDGQLKHVLLDELTVTRLEYEDPDQSLAMKHEGREVGRM